MGEREHTPASQPKLPAHQQKQAMAPTELHPVHRLQQIAGNRYVQAKLTRQAAAKVNSGEAPPIVHEVLHAAGQPLDPIVRAWAEPHFGRDFGTVRLHTDHRAADSAAAVSALAYTVGQNIIFGSGQYAPETMDGQRLIAHELAHVVQQDGGANGLPSHLEQVPPDDPTEREANAVADVA